MNASPNGTRIRRSEVADHPEFAGQVSVAQRMYALLRHGPLTVAQIAEQLEVADSSVRSVLVRKSGVFTRLPDGRVALLAAGEDHGAVH
ncbi:MAG: hypothetical protein RMK57_04595 [Bryobacterales bacterium]|nr:hypothetical protein [Bryobacteraceae bacterium]MDW8353790.1 hypothetical protein [Bryobacterales bacterium]